MLLSEYIEELQSALEETGDGEVKFVYPTDGDEKASSWNAVVLVYDEEVVVMINE